MEFENFSSVKASSRRRMPVWIAAQLLEDDGGREGVR
jgi:hypothetical protein